MVAAILDQILEGFPGAREALDFVEDEQAAPGKNIPMVGGKKQQEELIQVNEVIIEIGFDFLGDVGEVDDQVLGIFAPRKLFRNPAFADAAGPIEQEGGPTVAIVLPGEHFLVDGAFHGRGKGLTGVLIALFRDTGKQIRSTFL